MKRIASCLLSFLTFTAVAADLNMLTDNHPPLHFQQGNQLVGFGVDVVQALAERAGDQVHLQQVPLLRALHEPRWASGTTQAALAQRQHTPLTIDQRSR
ncbi:hypothetical protein MO767_00465 [Pseudomonas sp. UYIF39]|nr:transporter substrate-binding domain-containing protein [Pseudomonas sp. UYIF39]MDI3352867.1 hypothetical protein [Pseudomonas sp. UYIF39]